MLDYFELPKNGYHYHRIVQGFQPIFGATIFFGTEEQLKRAVVLDSARLHFFDRMHIWYNRDQPSHHNGNGLENTITLSEAFHNEIDRHKIPIERRVVAALANAPGILDLYVAGLEKLENRGRPTGSRTSVRKHGLGPAIGLKRVRTRA